jgi:hypothetical protein
MWGTPKSVRARQHYQILSDQKAVDDFEKLHQFGVDMMEWMISTTDLDFSRLSIMFLKKVAPSA